MIKTKLFKRFFSGLTVLLILLSQSPLGSLLWTVPSAKADLTSITVTSPNGWEYLKGTNNITWTSDDSGNGLVDIYYCKGANCFADPVSIAVGASNNWSYSRNTNTVNSLDASDYKIIVAKAGIYGTRDASNASFTIDNTAPSSNTISINGWAAATKMFNTTLSLWSTDANWVSGMQFSCDNSTWTTEESYSTEINFSIIQAWIWCGGWNWTKTVYVKYKDSLGNRSTPVSDSIIYDTTAPTITITNPNTDPATSKTITGSVNDWTLKYYIIGTIPELCDGNLAINDVYTTPIIFTWEDKNWYSVCFKATDAVWNYSISSSNNIAWIDNTNPTSPTINYWSYTPWNWAPSVTFTIAWWTDAWGVAGYQYSYDGSDRTNYTTAVTLSSEWTTTVYARTVDNAGNYSTADWPDSIKIDNSKPTVEVWSDIITNTWLIITGIVNWNIAWVSGYRWFNDDTWYWLWNYVGGAGGVYGANLSVISFTANAKYTLGLLVTDNAGNTGSDTMEFTWDTIAPTVSSIVSTPNPWSWTVNVTVNFTEALAWIYTSQNPTVSLLSWAELIAVTPSGAAWHTNWYINATSTIWEWTINVSSMPNGTLNFKVTWARDNALNTMADTTTGSLLVDTKWPTFTVTDSVAAWPVKSDTINVTVSDALSSVSSTTYGFSSNATCDWNDTITTSFTSSSDFAIAWDHTDYLCVKAIDSVGNISYQTIGQSNTDNTAPAITTATLTIPNGWESWAWSSNHNITWNNAQITDANLLASPITLAYSTDGSTWTTIATSEANDGTYNRTHPEINSQSVLVRITATDAAWNYSSDTNDAIFTIDSTHPTTAISNPIAGQIIWSANRTITSTTTDNFNIYRVYFYYNNVNNTGSEDMFGQDGDAPYTATLDTTTLANGAWYIYSLAVDMAGNSTYSTIISVTIDNTKPEILNNVINFPSEVATSDTLAWRATHRSLNITQVEYFIDTIGTNGAGSWLDLWAGTTAKDFGWTVDVSTLSAWWHTIYVHAMNSEWIRGTWYANKTFKKISPNDTTAPTITYSTGVVTQTTFAVTFSSNENGAAWIKYGLTNSYGSYTTNYTVTWGENKTITLAWLTCGTTYHYSIFAKDASNNEWNLSDATFTTTACDVIDTTAPTITYSTGAVTQTTSAITFKSNENGQAKIHYGVTTNYNRVTEYQSVTANTDKTISLSELNCGVTYHYKIYAKDALGNEGNLADSTFTTASCSSTGINVTVSRILNGNTPIAWWDYISGYHFRFNLTVNDINDRLRFKLSDRSNSVTTMAASGNTKVVVSENGVDLDTQWTTGTTATLTGPDIYSSNLNIYNMDREIGVRGRQLYLDMFYKIPLWSQWIFSTSYGIQADHIAD